MASSVCLLEGRQARVISVADAEPKACGWLPGKVGVLAKGEAANRLKLGDARPTAGAPYFR